jgi:eukaryotic-like serine/threonine-protein kinase
VNPERWHRIDELFRTVADRPPAERDAYLTRVCGDDEELRGEVLELLSHETGDDFLQDPIKQAALAVTAEAPDELLGRRIGPYRLIRLIGRGGMGAVYEAVRDDEQFDQQVALKLIRRGMDSDFVRERFLRERRILASLDHPHIARLFDGGTTADGLPYFVMEFVAGEPITEYCQRNELSLEAKLKLFRGVCAAVQHAHQKLIVHRDLKPGNILITHPEVNGRADGKAGTPKLLDFGIAKLLTPDADPHPRTGTAVRLMTPEYASPEQVRGGAITTATDVYTLGVVLYELLAGRRPYQFETYTPLEIERTICDTETAPPSEVAGLSLKLRRRLAGDLDNIVMMALRKEPARRYPSVERFSDDIRRYLAGLPVTARADTFAYRTGKFLRRHRVAVAAAALVLLSLLGGIVATTRAARQARAERARAERRFAQVRTLANTFLFDVHDKLQGMPGAIEARGQVARTALEYLDSLAQEAAGDPQLEWELAIAYQKMGDVQGDPWTANLGQPREAMRSYQKSLALAQQLSGRDRDLKMQRLLAQSAFKLGALQAQAGGLAEAYETLQQAVPLATALEQQTHALEDLELLQNCHIRMGDTFMDMGDLHGALNCYRHTLRLSERRVIEHPGDQSRLFLAKDYSREAEPLVSLGDVAGALASHRKSLALADELLLSPQHAADPIYLRVRLIALNWLGNLAGNPRFINLGNTWQGDARAALHYHRQSLALAERIAALEPKSALATQGLAGAHRLVGESLAFDRPAQSVEHYRKALTLVRALLAAAPGETQYLRWEARFLHGVAEPLSRLGDRAGALQNLRQSLQIWRELLRRDANPRAHAELHAALLALAGQLLEAGEHDAALAHYREALTLAETPPVAQSADLYVRWRLADSYAGLSRYHATRAALPAAPRAERLNHWREARDWARQSLSLWEDWSRHAPSTDFDARRRERAARAVAECDAALAKSGAAPHRN